LSTTPSRKIQTPAIKEAKVRFECRLEQHIPLGGNDNAASTDLIIGKIVCYHVANEIYSDGKINPNALQAVSRLAGANYATLGTNFAIERPKYRKESFTMKHIYREGNKDTTLLLLHGTGGTEEDLLPLAEQIDTDANILSVRGNIEENGMPRYFKRLREGVFDEEDLIFRTNELHDFINQSAEE